MAATTNQPRHSDSHSHALHGDNLPLLASKEATVLNPTTRLIQYSINTLQTGYYQAFGHLRPDYAGVIQQVAETTLTAIAQTDALYHDIEHTMLVTLVGQEILQGKQLVDGNVSPEEWLHFIVALLCHDIGYLKGVCPGDRPDQQTYVSGVDNETIAIAPWATDASLTPYHVDRSKQYVAAQLAQYKSIDVQAIQTMIELTRFPVPQDELHQATHHYPGLARAADLIGQLADPLYLVKLPALFREFEETGAHLALGYQHAGDLRAAYPTFFRTVVQPLIQPALRYLQATRAGQVTQANLYQNVNVVERELEAAQAPDRGAALASQDGRYHLFMADSEESDRLESTRPSRIYPIQLY